MAQEAAPGVGQAAADAFEVKTEPLPWVKQLLSSFVQGKAAGRCLLKDLFADQVFEHPGQDIGVAACRRRQAGNFGYTGGDVVGDPQGRHHVDAPRRAKIA
jgi:hypothetical protein